jgi:hypothetical protein
MEEEKYRIPLFDGNNYPDWKFHMTVYLDELDLLKHIETPLSKLLEEYPEPENGEAAAAVQTVGNGLIRNDKKCKSRNSTTNTGCPEPSVAQDCIIDKCKKV